MPKAKNNEVHALLSEAKKLENSEIVLGRSLKGYDSTFTYTVLAKAVLTRPSVCSKSAIFREAWHIVNLQPCPCPLEALIPHIRAFK